MQSDAYWIDAGTPEAYLQAHLDLLDGVRGDRRDRPHPDARVDGTATVVRSTVGSGAVIAGGAVVTDSVVMADAYVGPGAVLDRCLVGIGARIGEGAKLSDLTVVGFGEDVPAGTVSDCGRFPSARGMEHVMKALVTGGAGFIGSNLVDRLLAEGHAVDVVDNLSSGKLVNLAEARSDRDHEFTFHQIDICDPAVSDLIERRKPEVIFHLAAQIDVRVSVSDPVLDARINVLGSLNILEGARRAGTRKVCFASSGGTIYGDVDPADLPITESQPQLPISPYGVAKKVVTDYMNAYRALHQVEYTSLALANIYGPRQDPHGEAGVVAIFAGKLLSGERCKIFGDGEADP